MNPNVLNALFILTDVTHREILNQLSVNPYYDAPDGLLEEWKHYYLSGNIHPYKRMVNLIAKEKEFSFKEKDLAVTVVVHYPEKNTTTFAFPAKDNPTRFSGVGIPEEGKSWVIGENPCLELFLKRKEKTLSGAYTFFNGKSDALLLVTDCLLSAQHSKLSYILEEAKVLANNNVIVAGVKDLSGYFPKIASVAS